MARRVATDADGGPQGARYQLVKTDRGWHAYAYDSRGRLLGEGEGWTARGARRKAGHAAKAFLRQEFGAISSRYAREVGAFRRKPTTSSSRRRTVAPVHRHQHGGK
jgi:hypothetical protein